MQQISTAIALLAAIFVGFLQLSGWLLLPLAGLAAYGMQSYGDASTSRAKSYLWSFVVALALLALAEWLARLASLYMSGHSFVRSG